MVEQKEMLFEKEVSEETPPVEETVDSGKEVEVPEGKEPEKEIETKTDDVDDKGVSWKDRAKEYEARLRKAEQRQTQAQPVYHAPVDLDKYYEEEEQKTGVDRTVLRSIDERAKRRAQETLLEIDEASNLVDTTLDNLSETYPSVDRYKSAIRNKLSKFSVEARKNPVLIEEVAFSVIGRESINQPQRTKKPVTVVKSALLQSKPSGGSGIVNLSPDEEKFAKDNELREKEFTDKEIRELYKRKNK